MDPAALIHIRLLVEGLPDLQSLRNSKIAGLLEDLITNENENSDDILE